MPRQCPITRRSFLGAAGAVAAVAIVGTPGLARADSGAWSDLRPMIYGARPIRDGHGIVTFKAPYRAEDDRRVPVSLTAAFTDGRKVKAVSVIVDENPMPVAADVKFEKPLDRIGLGLDLRMNGPSPVHVVVEASDGTLYMAESMVRTSGLGACAAPPVGDPKQALKSLGQMVVTDVTAPTAGNTTVLNRRARLDVKHPMNTGMQMDQITLLYIPARYMDEVTVSLGDEKLFTAKTGFAMSENPRLEFDYRLNGAAEMAVHVKDTEGAAFDRTFPLGLGG